MPPVARWSLALGSSAFVALFVGASPAPREKGQSPDWSAAPSLLAPGVISTPDDELNAAFTPDQQTLYFSKSLPNNRMGVILFSRRARGRWTTPQIAPFSGRYSDYDPFVSPDGARLFFISNRPVAGAVPQRTYDIWVVERTATGWSEPRNLGAPVNTDAQEYYPTVAANGTLYFSSNRPGGKGSGDIYRARLVNGRYADPESLGDSVNTASHEGDPFIAPDESYLIFASYGRPDDLGRTGSGSGDLYLSSNIGGAWTKARHLDAPLSSPAWDYCPIVSPDGRYFYFSSYRGFADTLPLGTNSYRDLAARLHGIDNGLGNVYRVDIRALQLSGKPRLPAPTGPLAVGRRAYHWTDSSRLEPRSGQAGARRELMVYAWYPAQGSTAAERAPYLPTPR